MKCPICKGRSYYFEVISKPEINHYELVSHDCTDCDNGEVLLWKWILGKIKENLEK
jgi:hypothetical protein